ncbi:MAG: hypothetical protein GTO63_27370 [Anaerolineae bacterium]|nr:hypothetical protein [Anaerolineae bacterium]NIN98448.1 hypothetical protein [Anaerolineae bacterium]
MLLIAGLDLRWGWSPPLPLALRLAGLVVVVLGSATASWAMLSNAYFSTGVRIQEERGHRVVSKGPYRYVRHPGYSGFSLSNLGLPLMLGSAWALIPGGLLSSAMIIRTVLEDRTLHEELEGYEAYARKVRYRLIPGIW